MSGVTKTTPIENLTLKNDVKMDVSGIANRLFKCIV